LTWTHWPGAYGRTMPPTCINRVGTVTAIRCTTNTSGRYRRAEALTALPRVGLGRADLVGGLGPGGAGAAVVAVGLVVGGAVAELELAAVAVSGAGGPAARAPAAAGPNDTIAAAKAAAVQLR